MSTEWTEEAVRSTLASLPPEHQAMLEAMDVKAAAWDAATPRARAIAVTWEMPLEAAAVADAQVTEAVARGFDVAAFAGTEEARDLTPGQVHALLLGTDGTPPTPTPTREEGAESSEVPHSGEQPTPVQRRDAWLASHAGLVGQLEDRLKAVRMFLPYASSPRAAAPALAEEWAVLQLLKALRDMKAPEVPVDDTLNQPTLEEALTGSDQGAGIKGMLTHLEDVDAEGARKVHWVGEGGQTLHPIRGKVIAGSGDEEEVTCRRCLHFLDILSHEDTGQD